MLEIRKDVPPPQKTGGRKYPFAQMEIGDSVFVPDGNSKSPEYSAAQRVAGHKRWKITIKTLRGVGFTVWRLA